MILSIAGFGYLTLQLYRHGWPSIRELLLRLVLPAGIALLLVGAWMGYYNWRVTGNAFKMPYQAQTAQYAVAPPLLIQKAFPVPTYRHKEMEEFYAQWEPESYYEQQTFAGCLRGAAHKMQLVFSEFFRQPPLWVPPLWLALFGLPSLIQRKKARALLVMSGVVLLGLLPETWLQAHYVAPATSLGLLLAMESLRGVHAFRFARQPIGLGLVRMSVLLAVVHSAYFGWLLVRDKAVGWHQERVRMEESLRAQGGKHLILVRYQPDHDVHEEWVYNGAELSRSRVIWARSMNPEADAALVSYYADRSIWILTIGPRTFNLRAGP